MRVNGVLIQDTFAEAWDLEVARLVLTAISEDVAMLSIEGRSSILSPQNTSEGYCGRF